MCVSSAVIGFLSLPNHSHYLLPKPATQGGHHHVELSTFLYIISFASFVLNCNTYKGTDSGRTGLRGLQSITEGFAIDASQVPKPGRNYIFIGKWTAKDFYVTRCATGFDHVAVIISKFTDLSKHPILSHNRSLRDYSMLHEALSHILTINGLCATDSNAI